MFTFDSLTFFEFLFNLFQPTHVIIINAWMMAVERVVT